MNLNTETLRHLQSALALVEGAVVNDAGQKCNYSPGTVREGVEQVLFFAINDAGRLPRSWDELDAFVEAKADSMWSGYINLVRAQIRNMRSCSFPDLTKAPAPDRVVTSLSAFYDKVASTPVADLRFRCPQCGRTLKAKSGAFGKHGKCAGCQSQIIVPKAPPNPIATECLTPIGLGACVCGLSTLEEVKGLYRFDSETRRSTFAWLTSEHGGVEVYFRQVAGVHLMTSVHLKEGWKGTTPYTLGLGASCKDLAESIAQFSKSDRFSKSVNLGHGGLEYDSDDERKMTARYVSYDLTMSQLSEDFKRRLYGEPTHVSLALTMCFAPIPTSWSWPAVPVTGLELKLESKLE